MAPLSRAAGTMAVLTQQENSDNGLAEGGQQRGHPAAHAARLQERGEAHQHGGAEVPGDALAD
ncbi:hypothetical protein, partial [Streptomyces sp. KL116D]|uniref:hypothetical protein n=1 Tax=Streptomyces sp. KL116D TaxID=3045152 RepID=UPI00355659A2